MNPKFVLVAVGSAALAAILTYWAAVPGKSTALAKAPAGPPLVISPAGPEREITPIPKVASAKPSPIGTPQLSPVAPPPPVITKASPVAPPVEAPSPVVMPPPIAPPPTRVVLSPPKEIDRPAEPAVIHDSGPRSPNQVTINPGTVVSVRLGETLSVQKNLTGDTFFATLEAPLVAEGFVIAEKGARVEGKIVEVDKAGRLSGTSRLSLELTQVNTSDGQRVHLQTSTYTRDGAERNHKTDAAKVGGGAILGAIIGAAAGSGKGAGVGAAAGGAAGTGAVLLAGGRHVTIPVETTLTFRIARPITITERVVQ